MTGEQTSSMQMLRHHLSESLKLRTLNIPLPPEYDSGKPVSVAVLFSGGLDCTVLARMAHELVPLSEQIDLINVAFENPRVVKAAQKAAILENKVSKKGRPEGCEQIHDSLLQASRTEVSPFEACPDRETGRNAFRELQHVCPQRDWRFVAVSPTASSLVEIC